MFKIVIPSYRRASVITSKTLKLLEYYNIEWSSVYLFVVQEEKCSYKTATTNFTGLHIIEGPLGLKDMRNFITDYFPEGQPLLCIDDDIEDIFIANESFVLQRMTPVQFHQWTTSAFQYLISKRIGLFGVYPVRNGFFMKDSPETTVSLRFCVGALYGVINRKAICINIEEKEDFDRTLQFYTQDHSVLRYNYITIKTSYYKTGGGMQSRGIDRTEASKESCKYLLETYPLYTCLYTGKKSGIWEVRLKDKSSTRAQ